jgi:cytochrome c oxidase accessory protein FixG
LRGFRLRLTKWALYIFSTLVITHSFLAYFVGTDHLANMMTHSPLENWGSFLFMAISSATILFDFAWFREQFCTIVCPYGRFQSVLMDRRSLVITYNKSRGEPRATPQAKALSKAHGSQLGDCVNCYRCVQVCPTGIDIRRGVQMECIACTSCIDACDDVMTKLKKPTGLIRYDSLLPRVRKKSRLNYRAGLYLVLFVGAIVALIFTLALIKPIDIELLRAKDIPYTTQALPDGTVMVVNHFKLELSNESESEHNLVFSILRKTDEPKNGDPQNGDIVDPDIQIITAVQPLPVAVDKVTQTDIFIRFKKSLLMNGQKRVRLATQDTNTKTGQIINIEKEVNLVGPFQ